MQSIAPLQKAVQGTLFRAQHVEKTGELSSVDIIFFPIRKRKETF